MNLHPYIFKKPNKMPNEATLAFIEHNILLKMEEGINKARNKTEEKKTIRNDKINRSTT